jgi:hypothetical protein
VGNNANAGGSGQPGAENGANNGNGGGSGDFTDVDYEEVNKK